eukprot:gnl/TRDRNA2_/TRDRNA2_174640_c0_seq1.p1 gnl/TRDRNA2_/TRDRNA2_174640_c0~~gnl/TRDRNA2_/TRDRNA2_174640_c0_seq1.p1  ORF type:complete len:159 (+),score=6.60 gnl/TRDRNA2_/TRDRNA2_174640_c0_seq1:57-533(+)
MGYSRISAADMWMYILRQKTTISPATSCEPQNRNVLQRLLLQCNVFRLQDRTINGLAEDQPRNRSVGHENGVSTAKIGVRSANSEEGMLTNVDLPTFMLALLEFISPSSCASKGRRFACSTTHNKRAPNLLLPQHRRKGSASRNFAYCEHAVAWPKRP